MSYGTQERISQTNQFNLRVAEILENELGGRVEIPFASTSVADSIGMIDGYLINGGVWGLAIRVQYGICWQSFTLRLPRSGYKSEYAKLKETLKGDGRLAPQWFCQFYFASTDPTSPLLGAAIVEVKHLANYLSSKPAYQLETREAGADGNQFHVIWWDSLPQTKIITTSTN
jgi:hypothetical protein